MKTLIALALALLVVAPAFSEVTTNEQVPFNASVFIPCAGETVQLTGELHVLMTLTVNENGAHMSMHYQPMGVSGVGLTSGKRYQATGITRETTNVSFDGPGPFNDTFVNNFRIIGQGTGNNSLVHAVFHITINANGEITAEVESSSSECK